MTRGHASRSRPAAPLRFRDDDHHDPPAAQGRHPAPRGRARGPLAGAARHDPGHRGPRLRLRLGRRAPPLSLGGPARPRAVGGVDVLAAIAASTSRIELGPLVACTNFHNPALLAKQAATIDEISGGRFILGLGAGWNETEFRAYGFPFDHRIDRFEEAFTIIRTLLRDGAIDFDGRWYQARDCELLPRGPRPAGPPLMIGSNGAADAARHDAPTPTPGTPGTPTSSNRPDGVPPLRAQVGRRVPRRRARPGRGRAHGRRPGPPARAVPGRLQGDTVAGRHPAGRGEPGRARRDAPRRSPARVSRTSSSCSTRSPLDDRSGRSRRSSTSSIGHRPAWRCVHAPSGMVGGATDAC